MHICQRADTGVTCVGVYVHVCVLVHVCMYSVCVLSGPVSTVGPATRELDLDNNKSVGATFSLKIGLQGLCACVSFCARILVVTVSYSVPVRVRLCMCIHFCMYVSMCIHISMCTCACSDRLSGPLPRVASGSLRLLSLSNNRFNEAIPTSYKTLHSLRVCK